MLQPSNTSRLTVVIIDEYKHHRSLERSRDEVAATVQLLAGLGFPSDQPLLIGPVGVAEVNTTLREWRTEARRLIFYWTGHGAPFGNHLYLLTHDSPTFSDNTNAVPIETVGQILGSTDAEEILVLVDACYSGGGAEEISAAFKLVADRRGAPYGRLRGISVITSAGRFEQARESAFAGALRQVLTNGPLGGPEVGLWGPRDEYFTASELARAIAIQMDGQSNAIQRPDFAARGPTGRFLRNPYFAPDVPDRVVREQRGVLRLDDAEAHFLPKFRGVETGEHGWFFTGRETVLQEMLRWVDEGQNGICVLTGPPGSGKSAILSRVALLSVPKYRDQAAAAGALTAAPPSTVPPANLISAGVHAKNKSLLDCVGEFADALDIPPPSGGWETSDQFIHAIRRLGTPLTLLLDALDEAAEGAPLAIAAQLLRPLADQPQIQILVGTRPDRGHDSSDSPVDGPILTALAGDTIISLVDSAQAERDIEEYALARLTHAHESPYADDPAEAREAAAAVARHSQGVFLIARILTHCLSSAPTMLELSSPEAEALFNGRLEEVFAADLARFGPDQDRVRSILKALAWAEGAGLPRRDVWLTVANALTLEGQHYSEQDINWVMEHAGAHLIESGEDGQTVYRLYHQSYNDHFRSITLSKIAHTRICLALTRSVELSGRRQWQSANPYLLRHLAAHASAAKRIGELVDDPRYLIYAEPAPLMEVIGAIDHAKHPLVKVYWRTVHRFHGAAPRERAAFLHSSALLDGHADAIKMLGTVPELPWRGVWAAGAHNPFHRRLTGHSRSISALAFGRSQGKSVLASASNDGTVRLWDPHAGTVRHTFQATPSGSANSLAFGVVNGTTLLASAGSEETVRLWNVATGHEMGYLKSSSPWLNDVRFGSFGGQTMLIAAGSAGNVELFDPLSRQAIRVLGGHSGEVSAIALSRVTELLDDDRTRDRPVLASVGDDGIAQVWDRRTGSLLTSVGGAGPPLTAVAFGIYQVRRPRTEQVMDRMVLVVGGRDGKIDIWDPFTGRQLSALPGPADEITALAVTSATIRSRSALLVAAATRRGGVEVWDAMEGTRLGRLTRQNGSVNALRFGTATERNPDGSFSERVFLVAAGTDRTVQMWDPLTRKDLAKFTGHTGSVAALDIGDVNGRTLVATAGSDLTIQVWDPASMTRAGASGANAYVANAAVIGRISNAPVLVTVGGREDTLRIWEPVTGANLRTAKRRPGWGHAIALGMVDGRSVLAVASHRGKITLLEWHDTEVSERDLRDWRDRTTHGLGICSLAFGHGKNGKPVLITASTYGELCIRNVNTGRELSRLRPSLFRRRGNGDGLTSVAAGEVGGIEVAASASRDGMIRIWDLASHKQLHAFTSAGAARAMSFGSLDGQSFLAVATGSRAVDLYDPADGRHLDEIATHTGPISTLTVGMLREGTFLVTAASDGMHAIELVSSRPRQLLAIANSPSAH